MKEQLITLLETFGYPVYLQGSLASPEAYPDSFFTFWNPANDDGGFYSGSPIRAVWTFMIYFYSTDPTLVASVPEQARQALRSAGHTVYGKPSDVNVDAPTHTGAFFSVDMIENYTEE